MRDNVFCEVNRPSNAVEMGRNLRHTGLLPVYFDGLSDRSPNDITAVPYAAVPIAESSQPE